MKACIKISLLLILFHNNLMSQEFAAYLKSSEMNIDGVANEETWKNQQWYPIDQLILGENLSPDDFSGQFQLAWDSQYLYLHIQFQDDVLTDQYANPLERYWDDDCLEIFIDEDFSGGDHQFSFNAFAYHIALDNQVVDIGSSTKASAAQPLLFNHHITSQWQRSNSPPYLVSWEVALKVFDDTYIYNDQIASESVTLAANKEMGFMLAYCDNDGSTTREHFIGSSKIETKNGDKNIGYKTADVFKKLTLKNNITR